MICMSKDCVFIFNTSCAHMVFQGLWGVFCGFSVRSRICSLVFLGFFAIWYWPILGYDVSITYIPNSKDRRIDVDLISIRQLRVGRCFNRHWSEGLCYLGEALVNRCCTGYEIVVQVFRLVCSNSNSLTRECRFEEIFTTACTGSGQFDHFQCSQWEKYRPYIGISFSVFKKNRKKLRFVVALIL